MKITKLEAAGAQLDAAIFHFLRGDLVPAIHCAGAAEELCGRHLQKIGHKTVPQGIWDAEDVKDIVADKKEFFVALNIYRDWVKHTNDRHDEEVDLQDWQAFFYVQRAVLAYGRLLDLGIVGPRHSVLQLGKWHEANEKRIEGILGLADT